MEHRGWAAGSWTGSWLALPLDFCGTLLTVWIRALLPPPTTTTTTCTSSLR